jgi:isopentenyldiphosphate isomerase
MENKKVKKFPDGRIDYSNSNIAPVITVFLRYKDEILLLKRSDKVRTYQGKWNTVAGYLDDLKPIREKILEEIQEELGIKKNDISSIQIGKIYKFTDTKIDKTWIVHPALAELKNKPDIKLDSEHTEYKWINPEKLKDFDTVPHLNKSLENALK